MPNKEKVVQGLKACSACLGSCPTECPYYDHTRSCTGVQVKKDALSLMIQEPHVMTEKEALSKGAGYLEVRRNGHSKYLGSVLIRTEEILMGDAWVFRLIYCRHKGFRFNRDENGRSFRLWSQIPTDEQRKAAKWDD